MKGIIYVLSNYSMIGLIKIGHTTRDVNERLKELNSASGVPTPFKLEYSQEVENSKKVEREVHELCEMYRVKSDREFFHIGCLPIVKDYVNRVSTRKKVLSEASNILDKMKNVDFDRLSEIFNDNDKLVSQLRETKKIIEEPDTTIDTKELFKKFGSTMSVIMADASAGGASIEQIVEKVESAATEIELDGVEDGQIISTKISTPEWNNFVNTFEKVYIKSRDVEEEVVPYYDKITQLKSGFFMALTDEERNYIRSIARKE